MVSLALTPNSSRLCRTLHWVLTWVLSIALCVSWERSGSKRRKSKMNSSLSKWPNANTTLRRKSKKWSPFWTKDLRKNLSMTESGWPIKLLTFSLLSNNKCSLKLKKSSRLLCSTPIISLSPCSKPLLTKAIRTRLHSKTFNERSQL